MRRCWDERVSTAMRDGAGGGGIGTIMVLVNAVMVLLITPRARQGGGVISCRVVDYVSLGTTWALLQCKGT